jgi:hypothetical protein
MRAFILAMLVVAASPFTGNRVVGLCPLAWGATGFRSAPSAGRPKPSYVRSTDRAARLG